MKKLSLTLALVVSALALWSQPAGATKGDDHKVVICHVPPGNPDNAHSIEVDKKGWNGHKNHDLDYEGECVVPEPEVPPTTVPPVDPEPLPEVEPFVPAVVQPVLDITCTETTASFVNDTPETVVFEFGGETVVVPPGTKGVRSAVALHDGGEGYTVSVNGEQFPVGGCPLFPSPEAEAATAVEVDALAYTGSNTWLVWLGLAIIGVGISLLVSELLIRGHKNASGWIRKR